MTVDHVLEEAGVARATFYAHFSDKHEVTREVLAGMWERASDIYRQFAALPTWDVDSVRAWLDSAYDHWRGHNREVVALLRDMPHEFTNASSRHLEDFAMLIVGDGARWPCDPAMALCRAWLLIVQLERALFDVARGAWRVDREMLIESLALSWMGALSAP